MLPDQAARDRSFAAFLASLRGDWHDAKVLCTYIAARCMPSESYVQMRLCTFGQKCSLPMVAHMVLALQLSRHAVCVHAHKLDAVQCCQGGIGLP